MYAYINTYILQMCTFCNIFCNMYSIHTHIYVSIYTRNTCIMFMLCIMYTFHYVKSCI